MAAVCEHKTYSIYMLALSIIGKQFGMPSLVEGSQKQVLDSPKRVMSSEKGIREEKDEEQDGSLRATESAKPEDMITSSQRCRRQRYSLIYSIIRIYNVSPEYKLPEQFPSRKAPPSLASLRIPN